MLAALSPSYSVHRATMQPILKGEEKEVEKGYHYTRYCVLHGDGGRKGLFPEKNEKGGGKFSGGWKNKKKWLSLTLTLYRA